MTWTAPEVTRYEGPLPDGERATLQFFLDWQRATLLFKCAGLTGEQLAERTVPPSELSLLGLLRHLTRVERIWFRLRFADEAIEDVYGRDLEFQETDPTRAAADYARYTEEIKLADGAAANSPLEATFMMEGETLNLRFIYLNMIGEYARHTGHADLLRERIDGATGELTAVNRCVAMCRAGCAGKDGLQGLISACPLLAFIGAGAGAGVGAGLLAPACWRSAKLGHFSI